MIGNYGIGLYQQHTMTDLKSGRQEEKRESALERIRSGRLPECEHGFVYFCHDVGWIFLRLYSQVPPRHRVGQGRAG